MTLITESSYFPPISMLALAQKHGKWLLEAHENYQKGSFRNRCLLIGPQGPILLSVPLRKGKNRQQNIRETLISYDEDWPTQHWRTIETCYGGSPYFVFYAQQIREVLFQRPKHLFDLCKTTTRLLINSLKLNIELNVTSDWFPDYYNDFKDCRDTFSPKRKTTEREKALSDRIQSYSRMFSSDMPVSKISGLDLLFNCGPESKLIIDN